MARRGRLWRWQRLDPRQIRSFAGERRIDSLVALAEAVGVSEVSVFAWEREGHAPRRKALPPHRTHSPTSATEIVAFRAIHGWSRARLARKLGVSEATLHAIRASWNTGPRGRSAHAYELGHALKPTARRHLRALVVDALVRG